MLYQIQGTATIRDSRGWSTTEQIPTFYLHPNVQGIVSKKHAEEIAKSIINPLKLSNITVNVTAMEVSANR